ncbi:MAG: hypothetical protein LBQ22_12055 [Bacteroidales bacterium]|jgi:hypothetical protein|nr:hypothetical protein [Bacteroidales bacterium]
MNTLNYSFLTLIHIQIIALPENFTLPYIERLDKPNDLQHNLFYGTEGSTNIIQRYSLPGFNYSIKLGYEKEVNVKGTARVETSIYFKKFAVIRYYMKIDPFSLNKILTTGDITELAIMGMAESVSSDTTYSSFTDLPDFITPGHVKNYHSFSHVKNLYKTFLINGANTDIQDKNYVYVDVWEGIQDSEGLFAGMNEKDIIAYITDNMMLELNGLLLLNPHEWEYGRIDRNIKTSTGNIALDRDELIMLNENICISFASFGTNNATDWENHLREEDSYYVSWPQMYLILESTLIKKYALMAANEVFRQQTSLMIKKNNKVASDFVEKSLYRNADVRLNIANVFLQLDNIKYTTHKILSDEISEKFELDKQMALLDTKMKYTDEALELLSDSKKLRQSKQLNIVLAVLSSISVLGLLFNQVKPPFIQRVFGISDYYAEIVGIIIIGLSVFIILLCLFIVLNNGKTAKGRN